MYEVFDLHLNILNLNLALFPWPFSKITTLSSELAAHLKKNVIFVPKMDNLLKNEAKIEKNISK